MTDDGYQVPSLDVVVAEWHSYARESSLDHEPGHFDGTDEFYDRATDYVERAYDAMLNAGGFESEEEYDEWLDLLFDDAWDDYETDVDTGGVFYDQPDDGPSGWLQSLVARAKGKLT